MMKNNFNNNPEITANLNPRNMTLDYLTQWPRVCLKYDTQIKSVLT